MNKIDMLTGVMNRNAMTARIAAISGQDEGKTGRLGIVFADMNGLKYINDNKGHMAGDMLLKNAAMILKSTFIGDEIYRAGGDEFLILLRDTTEAEMEGKIADIRKKAELFEDVSFAAGNCLREPGMEIRLSDHTGAKAVYEITEMFIVNPDETQILDDFGDCRITLITCTDDGSQRRVVIGKPKK
jgi:diguanylate cyclase (GGDEF)-like protein